MLFDLNYILLSLNAFQTNALLVSYIMHLNSISIGNTIVCSTREASNYTVAKPVQLWS